MHSNGDEVNQGLEPVCHIVTPVGMLGYGLDEEATYATLASLVPTGVPTALILDSGSTDGGPSKLALGEMSCPREAYVRDLSKLLELVHTFKVPLIFSSAGGAGTDDHVDEIVKVIEEIAAGKGNENYRFQTIAIFAGIEKSLVLERLRADAISGCGDCVPTLTEEDITESPCIVAQMGPEPFLDAMRAHPDFNVIVGGRAYDPAPYVAYAAYVAGVELDDWSSEEARRRVGGFTHMGKIMECGGVCALPKSQGAIATVYQNGAFDITPLDNRARCTPISVAAHTLYEKTRPDILHGPGGHLDLNVANYEQLSDERTVRVHGGTFHWSREAGIPYQVKLEGGRVVGYRTIYMGSFKDPILIRQLDSLLRRVKGFVAEQHKGVDGTWDLDFHVYGKPNEPYDTTSEIPLPEVFIIGEALASSQELATSVASTAKIGTTHGSYAGQKATSGNFAFGIGGKMTIPCGPCAKFSLYHLMNLRDGEERLRPAVGQVANEKNRLFPSKSWLIGRGQTSPHKKGIHPPAIPETTSQTSRAAHVEPNPASKYFVPEGTLGELASVLRSKNAGPFEITFDVMFGSEGEYKLVKDSGILSAKTAADILGLPESDIVWCGFFDPARAFKITIPRVLSGRRVACGGFMEKDVHGAQQYLPLMYLRLPQDLLAKLGKIRTKEGEH
ncbi:hypothetical protein F5Y19DRAFT_473317 [Xylariaceae sp. FL1651]|nr:hypothetical protein F5Y19DRAFT_473317 [Xylariaceae sp. FL1651]